MGRVKINGHYTTRSN